MFCLFHKWKGSCKCERCGKTRDKYHDWNGCVCRRCGAARDMEHSYTCGVCTVCGKRSSAEGHTYGEYPKRSGQYAVLVCENCGYEKIYDDWDSLVDRLKSEIRSANEAGCSVPWAEDLLKHMIM